MPVSALEHSYTVLDRWLLEVLKDHGAMSAEDFAQEEDARAAGSGNGSALAAADVRDWLDSARRRGLLERYSVDLAGNPLQPPLWGLSDVGRARLAETIASTHFVPDWLGKTVLPLLQNAGKALLALASVFLAARATKVIHHGTISPTAAQIAIGVLVGLGVIVYLVIRHTDNRQALSKAIATITGQPQ